MRQFCFKVDYTDTDLIGSATKVRVTEHYYK